jgi:cyclic pyranopterin phosphate synthase
MPQADYQWLPRADILTLEEFARLGEIFIKAGGNKIRLTGGEPLLRKNLCFLINQLANIDGLQDLSLTTNGYLLSRDAQSLKEAGLHRLNISLDTLRPHRFKDICQVDGLEQTLEGIDAVRSAGFSNTKLDMVVMRGVNADELVDMLDFAQSRDVQIRFIEYMDVGGALNWSDEQLVTADEILSDLRLGYPQIKSVEHADPTAPARLYQLENGYQFGIIASMSNAFCGSCDRSRVTADGNWYSCLYATQGHNMRDLLRSEDDQLILRHWRKLWQARESQEAVLRAKMPQRQPALDLDELLADPHLEMHTRGG